MRDRNTMSPAYYLFENIWWSVLSTASYRAACFRPIAGTSFARSTGLLWTFTIASLVIGLLLTYRKRRNYISLIATVSLPLGVYSVMSCWFALWRMFLVIVAITVLVIGVYLYLVMAGVRTLRKLARHLIWFSLGMRTICAFGSLILTTTLFVSWLFGLPLLRASVKAELPDAASELTVSDHATELLPLADGTWMSLDTQEKLDVLQVLANIEGSRLGLGHELNVGCDVLGELTAASYRDSEHLIVVNLKRLNDEPSAIIDSICHEAYHALERRLVELAMAAPESAQSLNVVKRGKQYALEFEQYKDADTDGFLAYYTQSVEADAREHAELATEDYIWEIWGHIPARMPEDSGGARDQAAEEDTGT